MSELTKLPTLAELSGDIETAFKADQFNLLLNQPPIDKWILKHDTIKVKQEDGTFAPLKYLPIDKVELLLTRIFQEWRVEIIEIKQLFNSVAVHIRLHYKSPITGVWSFHDGVGAVAAQTDKGAAASDLAAIKHDAIMKALPAAKSYAIKDACDHLGKFFGRDLNRRHTANFTGAYNKTDEDYSEVKNQLDLITDISGLNKYYEQFTDVHKDKDLELLFLTRKNQLLKPKI